MKRTFTYFATIALLVMSLSKISAQDIHFSQFYHAFPQVNPALTGIFNGDMRFSGIYRSQWNAVPVDYQTFNLFFDMKKLSKKIDKNNFTGLGIYIDYDRAGDSRLSLASLGLAGSYTLAFTDNVLLTGGLAIEGSQRRFDLADLEFSSTTGAGGTQVVDPTTENFNRTSLFFLGVNAGLNLRLQSSARTKVDVGLSAYHLNTPEQEFDATPTTNEDVELPMRYALSLLGSVKLTERFDIKLHGLGQLQDQYNELVGQIMGKIYLNNEFAKELALSLGIGYRYSNNNFGNDKGDAFYPALQLDYRNLTVGVSYDINTFDFNVATDNRGGPEISFIYLIKKVKPLSQFKNCPIY